MILGQSANSAPSSEQEIRALEDERNRAILKGDAAALERMTADDYTFITLRGELRTKSEIVKGFQSGSFRYDSRTISDLNIRVYGDTAIVVGRSIQKGSENGRDYKRRLPIHKSLREAKGPLDHRCPASNTHPAVRVSVFGVVAERQPVSSDSQM